MDSKKLYWIWAQMALGIASKKARDVLECYNNDIEAFYRDGERGWRLCGFLTNKNIDNLKDEKFMDSAKQVISKCEKLGHDILTLDEDRYPKKLKNIYNPPLVLYVSGSLQGIDDSISIAIVGTRTATQSGLDITFNFAYDLAKNNCIVISGGALGIDSASHKGALQANGKTISVLGCGLNYSYLPKLLSMRNAISKNGALVSEYPPDYPPLPGNFPKRNRIISGLSNGVLLVEAGKRSGSLITANLALEQNRDVFAVPGDIRTATADGTNALIKEGAKPVTCVKDILDEYINIDRYIESSKVQHEEIPFKKGTNDNIKSNKVKDKVKEEIKEKILPDKISENAKVIYNILSKEPIYIDELEMKCNLSLKSVLQAITELELYGLINSHSGKRYTKD